MRDYVGGKFGRDVVGQLGLDRGIGVRGRIGACLEQNQIVPHRLFRRRTGVDEQQANGFARRRLDTGHAVFHGVADLDLDLTRSVRRAGLAGTRAGHHGLGGGGFIGGRTAADYSQGKNRQNDTTRD